MLLRKRGPSTEGVFRKTCNNKNMRDIREQLNSGVEVELEAQPVLLLVGLLKVRLHLQGHHVAGAQTDVSLLHLNCGGVCLISGAFLPAAELPEGASWQPAGF